MIPATAITRRAFRFAIAILIGLSGMRLATAADAQRTVVMVSVDGLAAFYRDDPRAEMPTIRALADAGAWGRMKASAPTVTWPNHTTLVTGVKPARHGVVGNDYYDRDQRRRVALILDPEFDKEQIIKVPTVYDVAKAKGLTTAAVRWPASRNAKDLDWQMPEVGANELLHKYTTPALVKECQAAGVWADGEPTSSGDRDLYIVSDETATRVFKHILHMHRPNLALLHVIHVDHTEHVSGPRSPEAYAAIRAADEQVREIWELLKCEFAGQATLVVVSDHGFSPIEHTILPNVTLRDAGLVEVHDKKVTGGAVHVVVQGGSALIYVLDRPRRAEIIETIKRSFAGSPGIGKVVGPGQLHDHGVAEPTDDPHAPDMILFAGEGYTFAETATGTAAITDESKRRGTHGHDENLPNLHATFVAWGAGIKPGTELGLFDNTDVAPTIAALLGLSMGETDGKPLTAALQ
jgi:predicted AlkP superfamily pyrophosphatase or phosphodiesterase